MSSYLTTNKTLELLEKLKEVVQTFTAREETLDQDYRAKMDEEHERLRFALEDLDNHLIEQNTAAETTFQGEKRAAEDRYDRLRIQISDAWKSSKTQAITRIEEEEGRRKYRLQTATMQAARVRKDGIATTEKEYEQFSAALQLEAQSLFALEEAVRESFRGIRKFRKMLEAPVDGLDESKDEYHLVEQLRQLRTQSETDLQKYNRILLPKFFKFLPWWHVLPLLVFATVPLLQRFNLHDWNYENGAIAAVGTFFGFLALYFFASHQAAATAKAIATAAIQARALHALCQTKCEDRHTNELARIEREYQAENQRVNEQWSHAVELASQMTEPALQKVDMKGKRISLKSEELQKKRLEHLAMERTLAIETARKDAESHKVSQKRLTEEREIKWTGKFQDDWRKLQADWEKQSRPLYDTITTSISRANTDFPQWNAKWVAAWAPPTSFQGVVQYAHLKVDVKEMVGILPKDRRLALPGPATFEMPLLLTFPEQGCVLFETKGLENEAISGPLNNIMLRLLSKVPPGRVNFTILDPVGLGQNFAGIMHLADFEEHLINSRIWTQSAQIEQKLADLNEHMEKVIQMYLRNEYKTIAEYNEQAGNIAEKYHFLVVANFPANFTDTAIRRLLSIASSGARCGVFTLIHWDHSLQLSTDFNPEDLRNNSVCVTVANGGRLLLGGQTRAGIELSMEKPPHPDLAIEFVQEVGRRSRDSNRVEVPFSHVAPPDNEIWSLSTLEELRVPIGRTGATKLQYLAMGKGTRQHGLIAGKTGSGKSTLFHVIITNLALWCSPEQVEFYLVDFKKGVEFKCYANMRLPHARVVAIESDREFGLSVLERVDAELKRRGDLFRKLGAQNLAGYVRAGGKESIPRTLLLIDEFQEFFVEDDKVSQSASLLLDRIVRQGRAFGIHVILGSQTLGGAYSMARATLGQMVIRIALQCNEADAYLIMDESNPAPRLLSRPGEAIYNDAAGALEGNSPFQTVWLSDAEREQALLKIRERAIQSGRKYSGPIVFEGDAPADVRQNSVLQSLLLAPSLSATSTPRIWLGEPNSIKGPTEALFQKQSGDNLLIVGQREETILNLFAISLLSLASQYPVGAVRLYFADSTIPDSRQRAFIERIARCVPQRVAIIRNNDIVDLMTTLSAELKNRSDEAAAAAAPATFLFVDDLQKFTKLRYEEDFSFSSSPELQSNPAVILNTLISEGASRGIHIIASCDSYNGVVRHLGRKALGEFSMRVLFQMSANDSASLIDSPKASLLGLHKALFFNEKETYLEVFRPYATPSEEWLASAEKNLVRLTKTGTSLHA